MAKDIPLHPVTSWIAEPIKQYESLVLRLNYVSEPTQNPADSSQSPYFVLTVGEAEKLARKILAECDLLRSGADREGSAPRH